MQNTDFNPGQVAFIMGLNLQIKKLQEVISLILDENIIKNDEDLEAAEEIKEVFQKHIGLIDTYKILHQSMKHNIEDHDKKSTKINDNYQEYDDLGLDYNIGESNINEEDHGKDIDMDAFSNERPDTDILTKEHQNFPIMKASSILRKTEREVGEKLILETRKFSSDYLKQIELVSIFRCIFCDRDFKTELEMNDHDTNNHKLNDNYRCISCDHVSSEKRDIVQHFLIEHKNKMLFNCSKCSAILMSYKEAVVHMNNDHGLIINKITCPICITEITDGSIQIKTHMAREHGFGNFLCKICDKKYIDERALEVHNKLNHGSEKISRCAICFKFMAKSLLKKHKEEHETSGRNVPCPECYKLFYGNRDMYRHKWRAHRLVFHKCDQCDYQTKYKYQLPRHLSTHSSDQPFACDECGTRCKSAATLKSHKIIHTGERKHICNFCGKKFRTSGQLQAHTRLHTKEYVAQCETCGQNFAQKCNYKLHIEKHHPVKV